VTSKEDEKEAPINAAAPSTYLLINDKQTSSPSYHKIAAMVEAPSEQDAAVEQEKTPRKSPFHGISSYLCRCPKFTADLHSSYS